MPALQPSRIQYISRDIPSVTRCFKNVILTDDGRVWLNPCYNENVLSDLLLVQFDGYDLFPVNLENIDTMPEISTRICGITKSRELYGYSENKNGNYLFFIDPYTTRMRLFDFGMPPDAKGRIRNVLQTKNGAIIVLTQSEKHLRLFQFSGNQARMILEVERVHSEWPFFSEEEKQLPLLETDQGIWFMGDYLPVFRFDPKTGAVESFTETAFPPHLLAQPAKAARQHGWENSMVSHRGQIVLMLYGYQDRLFQIDPESRRIQPVNGFPSLWEAKYMTTDHIGNLLFVFEDEKKIFRGVLQDTLGRRFDYSAFLENSSRFIDAIVGQDFFRQVFICQGNNLLSIGVRELSGLQTFPGGFMRGIAGAISGGEFLFYDNQSNLLLLNAGGITPAAEVSRERKGDCLLDVIPQSTNLLRSMYFDKEGNLWTHQSDNLIQYDTRRRTCTTFSTHGAILTRFSFLGERTIAFVSTEGALHLFDIPSRTTIPAPGGTGAPGFTYDILATPDSVIWVPTSNGLWRVDCKNGQSEVIGKEQPFPDYRFQAIHRDEQGQLWLGSAMAGLIIYDPATKAVRVVNHQQGLAGNTVWSIVPDKDGVKWVSTNNGLSVVSSEGEVLTNITREDGLPDNEFLLFGGKKSPDGLLLFATRKGMVLINPDTLKPLIRTTSPAPVYLTSLSYYSADQQKDITQTTGLNKLTRLYLPASKRYLELKFALPSYVSPSQNQFAYRLEGQSTGWTYLGARQELNLFDLPPGKYNLLIRGSDFRKTWSEEPLVIPLYVGEYFFRQTWFYLLCAFIILGVAAVWIRRQRLENKRLEQEVAKRTQTIQKDKRLIEEQVYALQQKNEEILKAQQQILLQEKMASLGQLTAGIAHEIKNPLNFVNNFAEGSIELVDELVEELARQKINLSAGLHEQIMAYLHDIRQNAADIEKSGKKVDRIVRSMMDHARGSRGELQEVDLNELIDENLNLAYHSYRARDSSFFIDIQKSYDPVLPRVAVFPQDLARVFLNMFDNAFYAVSQKQKTESTDYRPVLEVSTGADPANVIIRITDNGPGISTQIRKEIFTPFFTTKPTGSGNTGLGLSLSYDIIVKQYKGTLKVESEPGKFTRFIIELPRQLAGTAH